MKKIVLFLISLTVALNIFAGTSFASVDLKLNVNGQAVTFQYGAPFIDDGSSLVPLRDLLVGLGVQDNDEHITWNGNEQSVTIIKGDKSVKLSVGAKEIYLNGSIYKSLEVPAKMVNERVYLPARAVAEALGYFVDFDAETWTILVQEVPFSGGVKADDYSKDSAAVSSIGIETMKAALQQYTDGITLSSASIEVLQKHGEAFFAADRSKLSLDKMAKAALASEVAKAPSSFAGTVANLTFMMKLDSVRELQIDNGQTVTGAIGHTGGEYREMTGKVEDSTYFQVFYLSSSHLSKGDSATVNGVVVGESTIELTNALGVKFTVPMYVVVAGNLLSSSEEYDIRKAQSESNPGTISIPDLDKEVQKKLDRLELTLTSSGLKIYDPYLNGMEIKSVRIEGYTYKPALKTIISDTGYEGLTIPLSSFANDKSQAFNASGGSFFVIVTTNLGETIQFVDYQTE